MHFEALIERVWRCNWRPRLSELRDALGGRHWASLEMQLEAEVEWTQRCTFRPWSSEFGDAIGDSDGVNSEINSEAVIERVCRYTCSRQWSSEIGGVVGGGRPGGGWWEEHQVLRLYSSVSELETVGMWRGDCIFEAAMENWLLTVDWWGGSLEAEATFRGELGMVRMKGWQTIFGVCHTRCMLYLVYAALSVNSWWWHGEIQRDDLTVCSCDDGRVVDEKGRDGGWRWQQYAGSEQLWAIRITACLIGFRRPRNGRNTRRIGTRTCHIGNGNFTRTQISLIPSSSWWFPPSPLISPFLVLNSTITEAHKVKLSLSISPCQNHELTLSTAYT